MTTPRRSSTQTLASSLVIALSTISIAACSDTPSEELCPAGATRVNGVCIRPGDSGPNGDADAETNADAGPGEDATPIDPDAGEGADVPPGDPDAENPDADRPDAGERAATISTVSIDFGRVVLGALETLDVEVANNTGEPVHIRTGLISGAAASDYSVVASSTIGASGLTLAAGESVTFSFTFTPRAAGTRSAGFDVSLCDAGCDARVTLTGEGLLDPIECLPTSIDFGAVSPSFCMEATVTCSNVSGGDATIAAAGLAAGSSASFMLGAGTSIPATIAPAGTATIGVGYCPGALVADAGELLIEVAHPNPARATIGVDLAGRGGGPRLDCSPASLDFGLVILGNSRTRALSCTNSGDEELDILSLAASGVTVVSPAVPVTVAAGAGVDILVEFAPAAAGILSSVLEISTSDLDQSTQNFPLSGEGVDGAGCALAIEPASLDFGAVRTGRTQVSTVVVRNSGTGACSILAPALGSMTAGELALLGAPAMATLSAGDSLSLDVSFTPTAEQSYTGTLEMMSSDPLLPNISVPLSGSGVAVGYPLVAHPSSVDFGTLSAGCTNEAAREVSISNIGAAPLAVTVSFEVGSSGAFSMTPAAPATLMIGAVSSAQVSVEFVAPAIGSFTGRLRIEAIGLAPLFVPISGEGAAAPANVITFPPAASQLIDLLLVVDDSGSMAEEQARMQVAAEVFLDRGDAAGVDYHIGVTTTDPGTMAPAPPAGTLRGTPRYVTPATMNKLAVLQASIGAGTLGSPSEQGLLAARQAVSDPALLGGTNSGFLRADGELVVVVLSDEEDQSSGVVEPYVNAMLTRPIGTPGALRIYALTGGAAGCSGTGGSAQPETRYTYAANLTGGFVRSICATDYTPFLTEIADATFNPGRSRFQLGSRPAPDSVSVRVDGVLVPPSGAGGVVWGVDYAAGRVIFTAGNAPLPSASVEITYDSYCVAATCGNGSVQSGEECDDGNMSNVDACISDCYSASCGDLFTLGGGEQCDDGNTLPGDGCNAACVIEGCGNGILEVPEECDDGAANSDTAPNACRSDCRSAYCHDGVVDMGEACDDGNTVNNDACVDDCALALCGDGHVQLGSEQCDDGNMIDADLCNNACQFTSASFTVSSISGVPLVPAAGGMALTFAPNVDDGSAAVTIGFPFVFLGASVTTVNVSTNGFVSFETAGVASLTNQSLPNPATPNALIAWWWDDLNPGRGLTPAASVTSSLVGMAPNRVRILTFSNIPRYGSGGTQVNAEVRLYETSNVIEVHYGLLVESTSGVSIFSASAGWESSGGARGLNVLGCTSSCSTANWPASTLYTYTP